MKDYLYKSIVVFFLFLIGHDSNGQTKNILMFISYEDTYYSEYIVMKEALEASGYSVDVRSSNNDEASIYMVAQAGGNTIEHIANALPEGSSYTEFTSQFLDMFGMGWNAALNNTPAFASVDGRIQDVVDMSQYDGLVVVGGTGALAYRVDGVYDVQYGSGMREVSAAEVQASAEKLNSLALEALADGKPVMAQCHGASIPAFWRVPGTAGLESGEEAIGYSLLKGGIATGYPENDTPVTLASLDVTHRTNDRVTISNPHSSFDDNGTGDGKILTTRDWYPQSVAHAARTFINVLESYPNPTTYNSSVSVLILHGGVVTPGNCGAVNRANDIPCNYGEGSNTPADYVDLQNLLEANSAQDVFNFTVSDLNMTDASLPYTPTDENSVLSYVSTYDVVLFFKHWSTGLTDQIQNALVTYADNGGGVIALHHGLYNDNDGGQTKNILTNQLFGAESSNSGWSPIAPVSYNFFSTNYGHFVSTYGISYQDAAVEPSSWSATPLQGSSNTSFSYHQNFQIFDEVYNNMTFLSGQTFGRDVNEITPIYSNDFSSATYPSDPLLHVSGFVKLFDSSTDGTVGRVAYFQAGERKESININHVYGQAIRNAVFWASSIDSDSGLPVTVTSFKANCNERDIDISWSTSSETNNDFFSLEKSHDGTNFNAIAKIYGSGTIQQEKQYSYRDLLKNDFNFYRLKQTDIDGRFEYFDAISADCMSGLTSNISVYPNPAIDEVFIKSDLHFIKKVSLYDLNGNQLLSKYNAQKLNVLGLKKGVYYLKVNFESGMKPVFKKLTVQ